MLLKVIKVPFLVVVHHENLGWIAIELAVCLPTVAGAVQTDAEDRGDQARFDECIERYNEERTHQALNMKIPATLYTSSTKPYKGLGDLDYPIHDWTAIVTTCGRICYKGWKINLGTVFAGQKLSVEQVSDRIWLVSFMHYDLGYFDHEICRIDPIENPFSPRVLPMSPERTP